MLGLDAFVVALPHEFDLAREGDFAFEGEQLEVELVLEGSLVGTQLTTTNTTHIKF